jgi:hypothetical protein
MCSDYLSFLPRLRCLQISRHALGSAAVRALAAYLRRDNDSSCVLHTLVMTECALTTEHALVLAGALRREPPSAASAAAAAAACANDDGSGGLLPASAAAAAACANDSSSLRVLILTSNNISVIGLAALLTCPSLTELDLSSNAVAGSKVLRFFHKFCPSFVQL